MCIFLFKSHRQQFRWAGSVGNPATTGLSESYKKYTLLFSAEESNIIISIFPFSRSVAAIHLHFISYYHSRCWIYNTLTETCETAKRNFECNHRNYRTTSHSLCIHMHKTHAHREVNQTDYHLSETYAAFIPRPELFTWFSSTKLPWCLSH